MASQHDNFRLFSTLSGASPSRMSFQLAADAVGPSTTMAEIVQGMVMAVYDAGQVANIDTIGAAGDVTSLVGIAAWTGEANVEPINQGDICPITLAVADNVFLAEDVGGDLSIADVGVACEIDVTAGVHTIDKTAVATPCVNIVGYSSEEDKALVVFFGGPFTGAAITQHTAA